MQLDRLGPNQTTLTLADDRVIFFSYNTPVAAFIPGRGYLRSNWKWSRTTSKHIRSFIGGHASEDVDQSVIDDLLREETHGG